MDKATLPAKLLVRYSQMVTSVKGQRQVLTLKSPKPIMFKTYFFFTTTSMVIDVRYLFHKKEVSRRSELWNNLPNMTQPLNS